MTRNPLTIPESLPYRALLDVIDVSDHPNFPVVDDAGRLTGMLRVQDVRGGLFDETLSELVLARELARPVPSPLYEDDDLEAALERLVASDFSVLPVVSREDPGQLLGVLSQRDVLAAWGRVTGTGAPAV
jgi:CIC family chloride channel protein